MGIRYQAAVGTAYATMGLFADLHHKRIQSFILALAAAVWYHLALRAHERVNRRRKTDPGH